MSAKFDGGVQYYTQAKANITVNFPETEIVCKYCPLLTPEYLLKRERCAITGEIIPDPDYMTGGMCPLEFEGNNNKETE